MEGNTTSLVDSSEKGIFDWDEKTLEAIDGWNISAKNKDEKQLHLVSYLFEFVYDLMIAPGDNVSVNPGFESCHGHVGN